MFRQTGWGNMDGLWEHALGAVDSPGGDVRERQTRLQQEVATQTAAIAEYVEAMRRMEVPARTLHAWHKTDCRWTNISVAKRTKYTVVGWVAVDPLLPEDMEHLVTGGYKRLAVSVDEHLYHLFENGNTRRDAPALIPLPYRAPSSDQFLPPSLPDLLRRGITRAFCRSATPPL
jgi:hypothetical protein